MARLEAAGFDAREKLSGLHGFRLCNDRLEDGMTHAHAAAADWLLLASRAETMTERLAAQLEPLSHIAWDTNRPKKFFGRKYLLHASVKLHVRLGSARGDRRVATPPEFVYRHQLAGRPCVAVREDAR